MQFYNTFWSFKLIGWTVLEIMLKSDFWSEKKNKKPKRNSQDEWFVLLLIPKIFLCFYRSAVEVICLLLAVYIYCCYYFIKKCFNKAMFSSNSCVSVQSVQLFMCGTRMLFHWYHHVFNFVISVIICPFSVTIPTLNSKESKVTKVVPIQVIMYRFRSITRTKIKHKNILRPFITYDPFFITLYYMSHVSELTGH